MPSRRTAIWRRAKPPVPSCCCHSLIREGGDPRKYPCLPHIGGQRADNGTEPKILTRHPKAEREQDRSRLKKNGSAPPPMNGATIRWPCPRKHQRTNLAELASDPTASWLK